MNGKPTLYIDQYGSKYWARTVRELRSEVGMGGSRVRKMYVDKKDGGSLHIGYVVGDHWLTAYQRVERAA
jgi:hypothetical protein